MHWAKVAISKVRAKKHQPLLYITLILFLHPRDWKENKIASLVNAINNEISIQPLYWITARLERDGLFLTVWTHHLSVWAQKVLKFNQRPPSWTDVLAQDVALGSSAASSRARWHFRISYFYLDRIWCIRDDITSHGVRPSSTFNKCLCLINTGAFHDGRASLLFQGAVRFVLFFFPDLGGSELRRLFVSCPTEKAFQSAVYLSPDSKWLTYHPWYPAAPAHKASRSCYAQTKKCLSHLPSSSQICANIAHALATSGRKDGFNELYYGAALPLLPRWYK